MLSKNQEQIECFRYHLRLFEKLFLDQKRNESKKSVIYCFVNFATDSENTSTIRDLFCTTISWAIPTANTISQIKNFVEDDFVIDVGCGTGIWSILMDFEGINVLPIDMEYSEHVERRYTQFKNCSFQEAQDWFPFFNVLFISWPTYQDNWAYETLKEFKGNKFVYIGEHYDGCCANVLFFEELEKNWTLVCEVQEHKTWKFIYDSVFFYMRKETLRNPSFVPYDKTLKFESPLEKFNFLKSFNI